jgi:Ran GTPase-activating protein (RanGAP) involved in mRNA processing and transport
MHYFRNCENEYVLALPVLNMISDLRLALLSYKLNSGVCTSLARGLKANNSLLNTIILENNGLTDLDCSVVLEGLCSQAVVKTIVIKQNEVGEKSLKQLSKLLRRPRTYIDNDPRKPGYLDELRIIDCRISQSTTAELMKQLTTGSCYLSKVSLVNASFNPESAKGLLTFIANTKSLKHLDLSYSSLTQQDMRGLVKQISVDRKLISLDLSYN